ncbi:MAG TPA: LacI family DNA-binding transcriptional regulator [Armatimonadota bacterium]|jgi:LacI family transcriptional regulator
MTHTDKPIITLEDIAQRVGASRSTVCRALTGNGEISAATAARIKAVALEMGYNPVFHEAARRLVLRRQGKAVVNHTIAGVFPSYFQDTPLFLNIFQGVIDALATAGYVFMLAFADETDRRHVQFPTPPSFSRGEIDGLIAVSYYDFAPLIHDLRQNPGFATRPIVTFLNPTPGCSCVLSDEYLGGYQAIQHLLELGHRHILHSVIPETDHLVRRLAGCRQAMQDAGLDPAHYLHEFTIGIDWNKPYQATGPAHGITLPASVHPMILRLIGTLRAHPDITAYFVGNDFAAVVIWQALAQAGWRIPDDLSILGYDDCYPDELPGPRLPLSTIRMPRREMGRMAATLIMEILARQDDSAVPTTRQRIVETELVLRASTAPPGSTTPMS